MIRVYRKICDKVENSIVKMLIKVQKDTAEAEKKVLAYRNRSHARKKVRWASLRGRKTKVRDRWILLISCTVLNAKNNFPK